MNRRLFLTSLAALAAGCRHAQHAHVLSENDADMVGSHTAGAETWKPLIDESVARLLGRQMDQIQTVGFPNGGGGKRICFVGIENKSAEEIGDFKAQIYDQIDTQINRSSAFKSINHRFVEAGLKQTGLRPDDLFVPHNQQAFAAAMQQLDHPFDYLLYAVVTSGTTTSNHDYQRDYVLTLELVDIHTGEYDKESADIRKGYHKSALGRLRQYRWKPLLRGDG